jgi:hypothetical protein
MTLYKKILAKYRSVFKRTPYPRFFAISYLTLSVALIFEALIFLLLALAHFLKPDLTNYPYQTPPIFFSIGEAISSIAILLAIYQFRKDKWNIALKIRKYIEPTVLTTISIGVVLVFVSSFVLIKNPTNIFELSIFWQFAGAVFIAFSIVFLFLKATNKNLFNKKSAKRFYEVLHWELSRPSPDRVEMILNVLLDNLESICKAATQSRELEETKLAISILDVVLGEGSLVDLITTKRLDALHYAIAVIEKYALNYQQVRGFARIVRNLFIDENSFLSKHLERSGLALSANLYDHLFGSSIILRNFDLFGWPTIDYSIRKGLGGRQINVFIESLSKAIETYLKTGNVPPRRINKGISHLSEIFGDLCLKIGREQDRGIDTKYALEDEWWSLYKVANFLGHDYPFLAYEDAFDVGVIQREKTASEAGFYSNSTINEGIAAMLYKAFEQLTSIPKTTDTYYISLELLGGMTHEDTYRYKEGYRPPFEKRIWEQIAHNVIEKYYPAVLRIYLNHVGFALAGDVGQRAGWMGVQAEKMRRLLYIDLKPLLDKGEKMVNEEKMEDALLPDCMQYKNGKFFYTMGFGKGPTLEIAEPPAGSISALEGIDLKNTRSLL